MKGYEKDFKYTFVSYIYFDIAWPITGVHIHKLASVIFLILCLVHTGVYWKKMNIFRFFVLGLIFEVFLTGLFGMIFKQYPIILSIHTISSIAVVSFWQYIFLYLRKRFVIV